MFFYFVLFFYKKYYVYSQKSNIVINLYQKYYFCIFIKDKLFAMKKNNHITLQEISAAAGYSVAVVSRALSCDIMQNRTVAAETAAHIVAAARKLGWHPRKNSVRHKALGTVGVFVPQSTTVLLQEFMTAVNGVARKSDTPIYCYNSTDAENFRQFWDNHGAHSRSIGAVSYFPPDKGDVPAFMEMYEKFCKRDAPLVIVHNNAPDDFPTVSVKIDNFYGGKLAGEHLAELGCKENYLFGFGSARYRYERLQGCCEVLNSKRIPYSTVVRNLEWGDDFIKHLERSADWNSPDPIGVFVDGMYPALKVHNYFQSNGVKIGKKLKIISFDDSIWLECAYPAITAVRQPFAQMGEVAMKKLFNMMRGFKEKTEYIKPELIVRASTMP